VEIRADLECPACPLCGSDRREFPFRLSAIGRIRRGEHELYRVARCVRVRILLSLSAPNRERDAGGLSRIIIL
jgi:hypothetical protein